MELSRVVLGILSGLLVAALVRALAARWWPRARWSVHLSAGLLVGVLAGAWVSQMEGGYLAYLVTFCIMAGIYGVFSLGLNVQWGYTGLFNIGIAGFFALGAYTSALITTRKPPPEVWFYFKQAIGLDQPFLVGLIGAALVCGLVALLLGLLTLRLREDYLAIATIGVAETIRILFNSEEWLANGSQGLIGIPRPLACLIQNPPCAWLPDWAKPLVAGWTARDLDAIYLVIVVLALAALYWAVEQGIRSPWGRVLRAIREDEMATSMAGKNVFGFKLQSLVLGAMIMGIGGGLYAHYMRSISPDVFVPLFGTFIIWAMVMVGGSGNNKGAILGGLIVWGIWIGTTFLTDLISPLLGAISPELPARAPYFRYLLLGALLVLVILLRPQGLLGEEKQVSKL
ncbi:MAG: branched-chain amino acid ABC transporter permease [Candidatus Bipolaricaulota bacterium]|nr:branched-chain amino acid ABC transporter permease [Candidatus Bipolaricaulota bacterium]MCS7274266.1 branched-chain amino acid ABC transporter permease [Candidatus Bipolaricaulota bacterium]MDW8111050.1 branched-chain amino acid ABC transporter permease [Candidatus Bipolaricaulota bacterium]MDW8329763.1 branched-chain amino acid ABC transporter permease [Candidatus Bipolaricaulota bacterium]